MTKPRAVYNHQLQQRIYENAVENFRYGFGLEEQSDFEHTQRLYELFQIPDSNEEEVGDFYFEYGTD